MSDMTKERINTSFDALKLAAEACSLNVDEVEKMRDLALQSLSQEAVRDGALAVAVRRYLKEQGDEAWWTASERRLALALKREPNAADHPSKERGQ